MTRLGRGGGQAWVTRVRSTRQPKRRIGVDDEQRSCQARAAVSSSANFASRRVAVDDQSGLGANLRLVIGQPIGHSAGPFHRCGRRRACSFPSKSAPGSASCGLPSRRIARKPPQNAPPGRAPVGTRSSPRSAFRRATSVPAGKAASTSSPDPQQRQSRGARRCGIALYQTPMHGHQTTSALGRAAISARSSSNR